MSKPFLNLFASRIRSIAYGADKKETVTPYIISGLYSMASYPYKVANVVETAIKTADPTYTPKFLASNGDFNFTPTSTASIDTIYAGRDFQPTGTSIKIGSNGEITGGQGILVSSLGYKIENQGNIFGETKAKMSFGGVGGLENSQNVGVIFLGKSIATNDAEWAIIDANQGVTEIPSSSDRNKNIFVNKGRVSAPKIGIYANGDTEILNTGSIGTQSFPTDAAIYFTGTKASLDNDGTIFGHIISEANNTIIDGSGNYDESDIIIKNGTYNITFGGGKFGSDTVASSISTASGVSGSIKVEEGSEVYLKDTNLTGTGSGDGIEVVGKSGGTPLSYETKLTLVDKTVFNGFENDIKLSTPIVSNQNTVALYLKNSDNAAPGNDIIFNDHIYSDSADHHILINTNQGNSVILNNTIKGNGVGIYLQSGTLKLGKDGNVLAAGENYFGQTPASLFQTVGTLLDLQNNVKDTLKMKDWGIPTPASDNNADLAIDVNLGNSAWIDTVTSENMFNNAKLELSKINLLTESDTAKTLELYKGTNLVLNKPTLEANSALYTNNYKYTISDAGSPTDDVLELTFAPDSTNGGLEKAINDPAKNISYALLENTSISSNLTAPLKVTNFTLYGNGKTVDGNGKAGFNLTSDTGKSTLTIQDVTLQNFNPQHIGGSWTGSVVYADGDSVHIENSTLKNNTGSAAIVAADTTVTIGENVIFEGNETEYGYGSAVRLKSDANLSLAKGTIFRHNKTEDGGAIYVGDGSKIYAFDGVTFDSNASTNDNGGAINIFGDDATIGTVSNSVFNKNVAGNDGGAIYNSNSNAELNFVDTSFIDNKSTGGNGGAIYTKGSVVNFTAENNNAVISGNSDSTGKNAITFGNDAQATASSLNLKAKDTNSVYFDGSVVNNTSQDMNINIGDTPYQYYQGNVFLGDNFTVANNLSTAKTNYNVNSGGIIFANDTSLSGTNLTMATNTSLGLANNKASQINLNTLKLGTNTNLSVDIGNNTADKINATAVTIDDSHGSNINIAAVNTKTMQSNLESTKIPLNSFITGPNAEKLTYSIDSTLSGKVSEDVIFRRMLTSDGTNLIISTPYGSDDYRSFSPSVFAGPVAAQVGSYLTQLNSYEQALNNYDMLMALPNAVRQSM